MKRTEWSLAELAEETGVAARTIRYYIARGLIGGPHVAGRGAVYGPEHLERLREIQKLQRQGQMLAEIAQKPGGGERPAPEASPWWSYAVADGVTVNVRGDLAPWRLRQVRRSVADMAAQLKKEEEG